MGIGKKGEGVDGECMRGRRRNEAHASSYMRVEGEYGESLLRDKREREKPTKTKDPEETGAVFWKLIAGLPG